MSFFGAVRLYLVSAELMARAHAPSDGGSMRPSLDGAWARTGDSGGEIDLPPPVSHVEPGSVQSGAELGPLAPVSRVEPGPVRIARGWSDRT